MLRSSEQDLGRSQMPHVHVLTTSKCLHFRVGLQILDKALSLGMYGPDIPKEYVAVATVATT